MQKYELTLNEFQGPMEKLLELIEAKQVAITDLSLAAVTEDFLRYVESLKVHDEQGDTGNGLSSGVLADFLVIATRLMVLKSKALLPSLELTEEEEHDIKDLEYRLKLYQEFAAKKQEGDKKSAALLIREQWAEEPRMHGRKLFQSMGEASVFYPPPELSAEKLQQSLMTMVRAWAELRPKEEEKIQKTFVSVEEKTKELLTRLSAVIDQSFKALVGKADKSEVVALFLAILHLLRNKIIKANQESQFGDIVLKKSHEQQS
ncbi:MAG: hypothetical protein COU08_03350 [Candidatus Harrisonbacteria bacterium CG10_big_fil_rev_8_21_14_0_10_42_17]|uniref:Segregation and condensation protein A n=1 Tax=Candidatus Harrisonbacteria bacterium CG10_big_fil_rev_8_21_14_0_10_42_17 TaxID=1974584 RepID=A0A2M6WHR0_9BACT|nr:MAG: hypothetical protein COU08_03350 [Candidatus Harrisonbacteria bacterium CG10_big_fil_rev_8_21_14_0_10_42_17]